MDNQLVRWQELESDFCRLFPVTLDNVYHTEKEALVLYCGNKFTIRPVIVQMFQSLAVGLPPINMHYVNGFEVWGPPAINPFPSALNAYMSLPL